jgi:hypothetical protein
MNAAFHFTLACLQSFTVLGLKRTFGDTTQYFPEVSIGLPLTVVRSIPFAIPKAAAG